MGLFIIGLVLSKSYGWATVVLAVSVIIFCVLPFLQSARSRVLDVAIRYGYGSAEAFTRAFKAMHGLTPSQARTPGRRAPLTAAIKIPSSNRREC